LNSDSRHPNIFARIYYSFISDKRKYDNEKHSKKDGA